MDNFFTLGTKIKRLQNMSEISSQSRLTAQSHLETDPEAGLHDLTHRLVSQKSARRDQ